MLVLSDPDALNSSLFLLIRARTKSKIWRNAAALSSSIARGVSKGIRKRGSERTIECEFCYIACHGGNGTQVATIVVIVVAAQWQQYLS